MNENRALTVTITIEEISNFSNGITYFVSSQNDLHSEKSSIALKRYM